MAIEREKHEIRTLSNIGAEYTADLPIPPLFLASQVNMRTLRSLEYEMNDVQNGEVSSCAVAHIFDFIVENADNDPLLHYRKEFPYPSTENSGLLRPFCT